MKPSPTESNSRTPSALIFYRTLTFRDLISVTWNVNEKFWSSYKAACTPLQIASHRVVSATNSQIAKWSLRPTTLQARPKLFLADPTAKHRYVRVVVVVGTRPESGGSWLRPILQVHCDEGCVQATISVFSPRLTMANPRRVLIIGGGPCGLVTLRNLLERGEFDDVQLVERRDNIGGVW